MCCLNFCLFSIQLISVWLISEWKALGSPTCFQVVEFGPGKGTLAEDILRTFKHFNKSFLDVDICFRFVEVSKKLAEIQHRRLCSSLHPKSMNPSSCDSYLNDTSTHGVPLSWHRSIDEVPDDRVTFYVAHEFFDVLPIHKFTKTDKGWRELHIDLQPGTTNKLRMVILPEITIASHTLIKVNLVYKYFYKSNLILLHQLNQ